MSEMQTFAAVCFVSVYWCVLAYVTAYFATLGHQAAKRREAPNA